MTVTITVAYGDGVGPEIMEATLQLMREAGADISIETIEVGTRLYNMTSPTGILPYGWNVLARNRILLKAPTGDPPPKEGYMHVTAALVTAMHFKPEEFQENELCTDATRTVPIAHMRSYISPHFALFETPDDPQEENKGKGIANPCNMIAAGIAMLQAIEQTEVAERIEQALQKTLLDGYYTGGFPKEMRGKHKVRTSDFVREIMARLYAPGEAHAHAHPH